MKLSTKGRYAVVAMIELALNDKKGLLPLADLSLSQDISISYLEQLFARLRSGDLVTGVRGPRGGYRLARPAEQISIAEIVKSVDDKADPFREAVSETENSERNDVKHELTNALWLDLSKKIYTYLDSISLSEVISRPELVAPTERNESFGIQNLQKATAA